MSLRWRGVALVGLAASWTTLNAFKPLHVDDTAYYLDACQAARHPLDPYGFLLFWYELPEPASNRVAPPVLPYWLAPAVWAFPNAPAVWKLWLLPFVLAFVGALYSLLGRFAPGLEWPLLLLTIASPALLPSLNLMLDVPALALALSAQVVFMRAGEALGDERLTSQGRAAAAGLLATAAGLLAGLSAQTKYTGLLATAVMLGYAAVYRRLRLGCLAAAVAACVFVSWEVFTALQYSRSHFVRNLFLRAEPPAAKLPLILSVSSVLGCVAPGLLVLSFVARGAHRRAVSLVVAAVPLLYLTAGLLPGSASVPVDDPLDLRMTPAKLLFGLAGAGLIATLGRAAWRLLARSRPADASGGRFLVTWLALEVFGHLALSPFPAVRRVLGLVVVATLVLGRLASRSCLEPRRRALVFQAAALSAVLGGLFWWVDFTEAAAEKQAVESADAWLRQHDSAASGRVFFAGHWGFQYYAERAGMLPAVSGRFPAGTPLRAGDWLVVPSRRVDQQQIRVDPARTEVVHEFRIEDALPLATLPGFYVGATPLRPLTGPRVQVTVYRATDTFLP